MVEITKIDLIAAILSLSDKAEKFTRLQEEVAMRSAPTSGTAIVENKPSKSMKIVMEAGRKALFNDYFYAWREVKMDEVGDDLIPETYESWLNRAYSSGHADLSKNELIAIVSDAGVEAYEIALERAKK